MQCQVLAELSLSCTGQHWSVFLFTRIVLIIYMINVITPFLITKFYFFMLFSGRLCKCSAILRPVYIFKIHIFQSFYLNYICVDYTFRVIYIFIHI
jgi:hypothetical protein